MKIIICYTYEVCPAHRPHYNESRHEYRQVDGMTEAELKKLEVALRAEALTRHHEPLASKRYQSRIGPITFVSVCPLAGDRVKS